MRQQKSRNIVNQKTDCLNHTVSEYLLAQPSAFIRDQQGLYTTVRAVTENELIQAVKVILKQRMLDTPILSNPGQVKDFLINQLADLTHEVFYVIFLNNQHRVINFEEMFRGTVNATAVYPREVAKRALILNATAVIVAHNHPSCHMVPSLADKMITTQLKETLDIFDIKVMDHFIIGGTNTFSFAENGLL